MATKFGVQLKSKGGADDPPGGGKEGPQGSVTASGAHRSDFKTKPVSDLKSMFDKKDQEAKESIAVLTRNSSISSENEVSKTVKTDFVGVSGNSKIQLESKTVKTDTVGVSGNSKIQVSSTSKSSSVSGNKLTADDKSAFEALRGKLNKTDIQSLLDIKEPVVGVAKSKTFGTSGGTFQATIEKNKVQTTQDEDSKVPVTKADAASVLSFGLTKLRTRPIQEPLADKLSTKTESSKQSTPAVKELGKEKIILGVAKGWKGTDDAVSKDLSSKSGGKSGVFSASAVGKVRTEVKEEKEPKVKGFRSVSPVNFKSGSSDESVVSCNLSPRGYKPPTFDFNTQKSDETADVKTDINKNFKKLDYANTDGLSKEIKTSTPIRDHKSLERENSSGSLGSKLERTDSKPKLSAVEQLAMDKERLKNNRTSGSFSSDQEKGKRSPKNKKEEFKWLEKGRISLEEFKEQKKSTSPIQRPLSRASSSGSSSSLSRSDAVSVQAQSNRVSSPEPSKQGQSHLSPFMEGEVQLRSKKGEFAVSTRSKISVEKFTEIKKGFESKQVESQTVLKEVTRPKLEVKMGKKLLERKQSFEGGEIFRSRSIERQEVVSPRDRGNVLGTVKALVELDAKAKAQPEIMRRTKSLPSDSLEDDNSSSMDYDDVANGPFSPLYQVVQEVDDVSNEGDISSDADLIYEEIPAHDPSAMLSRGDPENKAKFKDRRSMAFKKRQKQVEETPPSTEIQAGNDGDIDSDSDSIYEPIDDECDKVSESDSLELPPEVPSLPPSRNESTGNKKKKKEPKGEKEDKVKKGFRGKLKQFYKGRSKESDPTLVTSSSLSNGSNGVLSKLKKLNKSKASNSAPNLEELAKSSYSAPNLEEFFENNPVCDSEGTDTEGDVGEEMSKRMTKSEDEGGTEGSTLAPPPLPPRRPSSSIDLKGDNEYEAPKRHSQEINSGHSSSSLDNKGGRTSPLPLPPRNRISNKLDLNVVVPVKPGGDARKSQWAPNKDSYLQTQKLSHPDIPFIDESPVKSPPSDPDAPPLPVRPQPVTKRHGTSTASTSSYVDADNLRKLKDSYVDVGEAPLPEDEYSLAEEIRPLAGRKELEKRPISSAYIKPTDLSTVPEPRSIDNRAGTPPVSEMMTYIKMQDGMYLDLSEDQVYGTAGRYKSNLESESLYQFYNKEKITRASRRNAIYSDYIESDEEDDYSSGAETRDSIYEDLSEYSSSGRGSMELEKPTPGAAPSPGQQQDKISTLDMFGKKGTVLRTLWAEMPEVKASGVLEKIAPQERKLQEHMFEILTSEATYLKSMNILIDVFLKSQEFGVDSALTNKCVLTKQERHYIFSNIGAIRDASERFLASLEARWKQNVVLSDICDIIAEHASKHFDCYIHYCSNQVFQDRTVTEL
ncbi:hypothetical protein DPMN_124233, partial [Dreissena polymorpha]